MNSKKDGKSFSGDVENEKWISKNVNLPNFISKIVYELTIPKLGLEKFKIS